MSGRELSYKSIVKGALSSKRKLSHLQQRQAQSSAEPAAMPSPEPAAIPSPEPAAIPSPERACRNALTHSLPQCPPQNLQQSPHQSHAQSQDLKLRSSSCPTYSPKPSQNQVPQRYLPPNAKVPPGRSFQSDRDSPNRPLTAPASRKSSSNVIRAYNLLRLVKMQEAELAIF